MKNFLSLTFILGCLLAASCGGHEDPLPEEADAPVLLGTVPENGATGFTGSSLSVVFHFDQNIRCTIEAQSGISIDGGAAVDKVSAYSTDLTVDVSGLKRGTTYTLKLPAGTVLGYRNNQKPSEAFSFSFSTKPADVDADPFETGVDPASWEKASAAVLGMGIGWNLGNTLDSHSNFIDDMWIELRPNRTTVDYETAWGQPVATRELIHMFKEAGFGAIRVPVTWFPHMGTIIVERIKGADGKERGYWDKSTWTGYDIDPAWMARVKEVVEYVLREDMYCILNVHHDTGADNTAWLSADEEVYGAVRERYCELWKQIATEFEPYGHKLVFESFNEMLDTADTWNHSTPEAHEVINKYNADFVSTVRATGGKNAHRNLILNTYAASTDVEALTAFRLPKDTAQGRLMAEVHSYAPYNFAFDTKWPKETFDASCEREVKGIIDNLNTYLVSKGIPCVLGEFGATSPRADAEVAKQAACYVSNAVKYNIPCFYWMKLSDGADRTVPKWTKPALKDAVLKAYYDNLSH